MLQFLISVKQLATMSTWPMLLFINGQEKGLMMLSSGFYSSSLVLLLYDA